mmetsp:Transcript_11560/g.23290  ORF Transcript_11560/g.23290 Transcript_11560/m.23290 type:complete len:120 (+) Transcript_11560:30-389(+)
MIKLSPNIRRCHASSYFLPTHNFEQILKVDAGWIFRRIGAEAPDNSNFAWFNKTDQKKNISSLKNNHKRCAITNVLGVFNTRRNNFSSSFSLMSTIPPNSYFQTPLPLTSFLATSFPNK